MSPHPSQTRGDDLLSPPIFGFRVSDRGFDDIVRECVGLPTPGQGVRQVLTTNLDHIVHLRKKPGFRRAYDGAWRRLIDGAPVLLYARLRGVAVPERITGADLVPELLARCKPGRHRLFFTPSTEEIARGLRSWADRQGFTPDQVAIVVPAFGFEHDQAQTAALAELIRAHGTTHLFFGVGCPKSETWIEEHKDLLGDCYAFPVGAALAFFVGATRRAPAWMSRAGFEWLWRVGQEPRRLARRYFVGSWGFLAAVIDDMRFRGQIAR